MIAIFMYTGFILWFLAGISTGILIERKRRIKAKIQERLHRFPTEADIVQQMFQDIEGMELSNFDMNVSKNDVSKYRQMFADLERKKIEN